MNIKEENILIVDNVKKYFDSHSGFSKEKINIKAVDGVSFDVRKGSVFAIVGESGCGKSTLAKIILRLLPITEGRIFFKGIDILNIKHSDIKLFRKAVQIIFQDPFSSLNPRQRIIDAISEPIKIHKTVKKREIKDKVVSLLEQVGLSQDVLNKYPHQFSGGQRQRLCIARAISLNPELLIADEPLSALDVSIQAQIINLLKKIKENFGLTLIFISHDLNVVRYLSDEIAVMYLGKIVEIGNSEDLFNNPKHPYTKLLLNSIPKIKKYQNKPSIIDLNQ